LDSSIPTKSKTKDPRPKTTEISDHKSQISEKFSGDFVDRVTPVPIPNTEVKPVGADGTARETVWESRKSPGLFKEARESNFVLAGFFSLRFGLWPFGL